MKALQRQSKSERNGTQGLLSPIMQLPNEILLEIFHWIMQRWDLHRERRNLPFVCVRWKQVIYATPEFWTEISCNLSGKKTTITMSRMMLQERLLRAGRLPISLTVSFCGDIRQRPRCNAGENPEPLLLQSIRSLEVTSSGRWTMPPQLLSQLLGTMCPSLPSLEHLCLSGQEKGEIIELDIRTSAPQLRQPRILGTVPQGVQLSLSQLTQIDAITPPDFRSLSKTISQCSSLEEVKIAWHEFNLEEDASPPHTAFSSLRTPITLPHLQSMHITPRMSIEDGDEEIPELDTLLSGLTLPALDEIMLYGTNLPTPDILVPFAARSFF